MDILIEQIGKIIEKTINGSITWKKVNSSTYAWEKKIYEEGESRSRLLGYSVIVTSIQCVNLPKNNEGFIKGSLQYVFTIRNSTTKELITEIETKNYRDEFDYRNVLDELFHVVSKTYTDKAYSVMQKLLED